jgi:hypothetical protein
VPASITLAHLHHVTQTVMGWEDYHLHEFETDARRATSGRSIWVEVPCGRYSSPPSTPVRDRSSKNTAGETLKNAASLQTGS